MFDIEDEPELQPENQDIEASKIARSLENNDVPLNAPADHFVEPVSVLADQFTESAAGSAKDLSGSAGSVTNSVRSATNSAVDSATSPLDCTQIGSLDELDSSGYPSTEIAPTPKPNAAKDLSYTPNTSDSSTSMSQDTYSSSTVTPGTYSSLVSCRYVFGMEGHLVYILKVIIQNSFLLWEIICIFIQSHNPELLYVLLENVCPP